MNSHEYLYWDEDMGFRCKGCHELITVMYEIPAHAICKEAVKNAEYESLSVSGGSDSDWCDPSAD